MTDNLRARSSGLQPSLASKARKEAQTTFFPTLKINHHAHFGSPDLPSGLIAWMPWSTLSRANRYQIFPRAPSPSGVLPSHLQLRRASAQSTTVTVKNRGGGNGANSGQVSDQSFVRKLTSSSPHSI